LFATERRRSELIRDIRGNWFYKEPMELSEKLAGELRDVVSNPALFTPNDSIKMCGGFHADFAFEWSRDNAECVTLICFGCREAKTIAGGAEEYVDMTDEANGRLAALLRGVRRHRPASHPSTAPTPAHTPPPNTVCFVCGAAAYSFFRSKARAACGACHHRTRLVVGGASLPEVLRSTRPYPLEGNGLNVVLNPVEIDGHRGWASFFGGSFQVLEEVHPSRDYFDFAVQHVDPGPAILTAIHAARLSANADMKQLFAALKTLSPPHQINDLFDAMPWLPIGTEAAVAAHLPITSNEQAWKAAEARLAGEGTKSTPEDFRAYISRLVGLAR
jgi:hypothetical protein